MPYQLLHNNIIIWNMEDADDGEEDEGRAHVPIVVQRIQRCDWRMRWESLNRRAAVSRRTPQAGWENSINKSLEAIPLLTGWQTMPHPQSVSPDESSDKAITRRMGWSTVPEKKEKKEPSR